MSVHTLLQSLKSRTKRPPTHDAKRSADRRLAARRLLLEGLEDRRLMAFDVLAEYPTAYSTQQVELALIDGDSRLDLVLVEGGRVSIRPGNADGTFGNPLAATGEILAQRVVTGDFNNDGTTDVTSYNYSQISLRFGNGDGSFQAPQSFDLPPQLEPLAIVGGPYFNQSAGSIATGDLNADGKLDLVVGGTTTPPTDFQCGYYSCGYTYSYNGYVNVLLGTGGGSFDYVDADPSDADPNAHPLGAYQSAGALAISDVNNDGQQDVVASKYYGGIATLLGNGTGELQNPIRSGSGNGFSSISLGDLDGDGNLDSVLTSGNDLIVQKGQGNGSFVQAAVVNVGQKVDSAVIGDVDGDGKLDLVAVGTLPCTSYGYYGGCYDTTHTRQVSVLLGDGQGDFSLPIASSLGIVNQSYVSLIDVALADLTGDGLMDLVTIDSGFQRAVIVATNDGFWNASVALAITDVAIVEGNSGSRNAVFTVTLTGDPVVPVTVDFATFDDYEFGGLYQAQAGVDYAAMSGTLTFGLGVLSQTITVPVIGDRIGELNETFLVNLSNPTNAILRDAVAVGTIVDDEPIVSISGGGEVVEGNSGTKTVLFTVSLSEAYDADVTVNYVTVDGSASAGSDYVAATATATIPAGQLSKTFTVLVKGDLLPESDEYFYVNLTGATGASIADYWATVNILDDDTPPMIFIGDASIVEGNSGTKLMTFDVSLSKASGQGVWVNFATANGTATTSNNDYVAKSGSIYFAPGEMSKTISVTIKGDTKKEKDERFYMNLSSASGGMISDSQGLGTILNDDGGNARGNAFSSALAVDAAVEDMFNGRKKPRR